MLRRLVAIQSRIKLGTLLIGTVALLSALSAAGIAWRAAESWTTLRRAEAAVAADAAANRLAGALTDLLVGQLATHTALQGQNPATPAVLKEIANRRAAVDANLTEAVALLAVEPFPGRETLLPALQAAQAELTRARQAADGALVQPRDARAAAAVQGFLPAAAALGDTATRIWFAASQVAAGYDPVLTTLAQLKQLGWRMRNAAGAEQTSMAAAIAGGRLLTAEEIGAGQDGRTRTDLLWDQVKTLAPLQDAALNPAIRDALVEAQKWYFTELRTFIDRFRGIGASMGRYPVDINTFVIATSPLLDRLTDVTRAAAIASDARAHDLEARARLELAVSLVALIACLLIAAGATRGVVLRFLRPLRALTIATGQLAEGRLETDVPGTTLPDEVGEVARALETLRDGARQAKRLEAEAAAEGGRRNLRQAAMDQHTQDFGASVSGVLVSLGQSADEMRQAAAAMEESVERTGTVADSTATGAGESARNLGAVAAATEELTASATEIARQVAEAAVAAREAVDRAETTGSKVHGLSEAASRIGDVVRLINDIAGQTNLLALNATIEAARAGEAGKGFAVVASEVKALAAQTARATEEIGQQIGGIQAATSDAVAAVAEVQTAIQRMDSVATAIAAAVEEQGAATREIAGSVQTVAHQTSATTEAMTEVSAAASGTRDETRKSRVTATEVARLSEQLHEEMEHYLAAMRATDEQRRQFERIPGNGASATLDLGGGQRVPASLRDISVGGAALLCRAMVAPGVEVAIAMPGVDQPLTARVARRSETEVGVAFLQNPANRALVEAAMGVVAGMAGRKAAA